MELEKRLRDPVGAVWDAVVLLIAADELAVDRLDDVRDRAGLADERMRVRVLLELLDVGEVLRVLEGLAAGLRFLERSLHRLPLLGLLADGVEGEIRCGVNQHVGDIARLFFTRRLGRRLELVPLGADAVARARGCDVARLHDLALGVGVLLHDQEGGVGAGELSIEHLVRDTNLV